MTTGSPAAIVRRHLVERLGAPETVATYPAAKGFPAIEIANLADQPVGLASTLVTIGMSSEAVRVGNETTVRCELALSVWSRFLPEFTDDIATTLGALARVCIATGVGFPPGSLYPFTGPVLEGLPFDTVYAADISYFDLETRIVRSTNPKTILSWLFPVFAQEVAFIRDRGYEAFEAGIMADPDADVMDLERAPFRLPTTS